MHSIIFILLHYMFLFSFVIALIFYNLFILQFFNMRRHSLISYQHTTFTFNSQNLNAKKSRNFFIDLSDVFFLYYQNKYKIKELPDEVSFGNIVHGLKEKNIRTIIITLVCFCCFVFIPSFIVLPLYSMHKIIH